jgi:hypothetical protein
MGRGRSELRGTKREREKEGILVGTALRPSDHYVEIVCNDIVIKKKNG